MSEGLVSQPESPLRPGQSPKVLSGDTEPPLFWGLCQSKLTCHLRDYISETHFKKDKLGPWGPYLCPCPWEAEKGEGEEKKEGQWEGQTRLWKAISGEWEMTFSVCLALAAQLPPLPRASMGLCCGPGQWGYGQGITLGWGLRARGTEGLG